MSRQITAASIGVIIAVALIFAIFDTRVSFKHFAESSGLTRPPSAPN